VDNLYGYACLTAAEVTLTLTQTKDRTTALELQARACRCDPEGAQIPIPGGMLACDGPDRPVERGNELSLAEAQDIRACAECDAERGPEACRMEIDRLRVKDPEVARYVETTHVPRCKQR
jgi:hypothetical protein